MLRADHGSVAEQMAGAALAGAAGRRAWPGSARSRLVRSFDHSDLAALPGYPALRARRSETLAWQAADTALAAFAAAVRDMVVAAPFSDLCGACSNECARDHSPGAGGESCVCGDCCWPYAAARTDDWITRSCRCRQGHAWTCGDPIGIAVGRLLAERTAPVCSSATVTGSSPPASRPPAS